MDKSAVEQPQVEGQSELNNVVCLDEPNKKQPIENQQNINQPNENKKSNVTINNSKLSDTFIPPMEKLEPMQNVKILNYRHCVSFIGTDARKNLYYRMYYMVDDDGTYYVDLSGNPYLKNTYQDKDGMMCCDGVLDTNRMIGEPYYKFTHMNKQFIFLKFLREEVCIYVKIDPTKITELEVYDNGFFRLRTDKQYLIIDDIIEGKKLSEMIYEIFMTC